MSEDSKRWVVWSRGPGGSLDYEFEDSEDAAFENAWGVDEYSERSNWVSIERPDGTEVDPAEVERWIKAKNDAKRSSEPPLPPKPPVAMLTIQHLSEKGAHRGVLYQVDNVDAEYQEALQQFGADRVKLEILPKTTLVWVGKYERHRRTNLQQERINESREWMGHPIETPAHTYEDVVKYEAKWREGEFTAAEMTEYSAEAHKAVVVGTDKTSVQALLDELAQRLRSD
ncbi:Uncharacterised protein [Mycobacteroides abscessus subsp. abscessus]|uniref:hypothetical protein n=1 Tax=Mycobacteroides abscessus TaxID=36809 RepID=UPI0009A7EDA3|nr:hypothetical protein [Mycobacteroides abscessus]SKF77593.1 Uncharacterised protein [Mycobacteroides abscessus subsp. abscessus]